MRNDGRGFCGRGKSRRTSVSVGFNCSAGRAAGRCDGDEWGERRGRTGLESSATGYNRGMHKNRLEAFSDGVLAIIITIMVLELKHPEGADASALVRLAPMFLSYVLSFLYVGIYWNNHHHLLQAAQRVSGGVLWANLHLLFWLSLFPFATAWLGTGHVEAIPTAFYGAVLFMAAVAYYVLQRAIIYNEGRGSVLASALGPDWKGKLSPVVYVTAIGAAFVNPWISNLMYAGVALMWLAPDRRIERELHRRKD